MPSALRKLQYLLLKAVAWLLWLPLTGNLRHDRTYGELKRLSPKETALMLVPLGCYLLVGGWIYAFFPPQMYGWAAAAIGTGVALGGTLILSSVVTSKVLDWSLVHTNR